MSIRQEKLGSVPFEKYLLSVLFFLKTVKQVTITAALTLAYLVWVNVIAFYGGFWVYPVFKVTFHHGQINEQCSLSDKIMFFFMERKYKVDRV